MSNLLLQKIEDTLASYFDDAETHEFMAKIERPFLKRAARAQQQAHVADTIKSNPRMAFDSPDEKDKPMPSTNAVASNIYGAMVDLMKTRHPEWTASRCHDEALRDPTAAR